MALVDRDDMVKAFTANRPNDALSEGIRLWHVYRRQHGLDPDSCRPVDEVRSVATAAVADKEPRGRTCRACGARKLDPAAI